MPPKKSPPPKGPKKKAAAPDDDGDDEVPAKPKKPARKASGKPKAPKVRKPTKKRSWRWVLVREATPILLGVAAGLGLAGYVLWRRAATDVEAWLASPPKSVPSVVWSAPVEVRVGQQAAAAEIAGDLLAAGYDRVDKIESEGQFAVSGGRLDVWTAPYDELGVAVPGGRASIRVTDGRVTDLGGQEVVVLRPTALATLGDLEAHRTAVDLDHLSPWVEPAVLAMEDRRFREHRGVDPIGLLRAVVRNALGGDRVQGGSTITQQLAKNLFLTQERTVQRKVREVFFAAALEHRLDKDEILAIYLGEVYLGQVGGVPVHGVEQAARGWFGVSAERLTLDQAATIAGVIASPNSWSPVRHPEAAVERRDVVLSAMVDAGFLEPSKAEDARKAPLEVTGTLTAPFRRAPWAVDAAIDTVEARADADGPFVGWQVHTTIQPLLQRAAERAVLEGMAELDREYPKAAGAQVALIAVRVSDGSVVALVGGRDYATSPFDRATSAWRQAGSTVKPFTLLAAFDADPDLHPLSRVVDEPITRTQEGGKAWTPANYDGRYLGEISLRQAIEESRNVPAVKLAETVGLADNQRFLESVGLSRATAWHSQALGAFEATPWEVAGAYTVFPGGGTAAVPRLVRVADQASTGDHVAVAPAFTSAASARAAALATAVLQGVVTDGTGARVGRYGVEGAVGGKTGTTDDYRDAWFAGFTPDLAVVVWVGNDRGEPVGLSGSRAALPTWARFVAAAGEIPEAFALPDGVVQRPACVASQKLARDACPLTYTETFSKGHVPTEHCDVHGSAVVKIGGFIDSLFRRKKADVEGAEDPR